MSKILPEDKVYYCEQYITGKMNMQHIGKILNVSPESVRTWIKQYQAFGAEVFYKTGYTHYTGELKLKAVEDYQNGSISQIDICNKYKIKSKTQLQRWILKYNSHEELKSSKKGGYLFMTKGRKTSFKERIEIVQHCIANNHNYSATAEAYHISYQQARNYTIKYEKYGIEGLKDKRGHHKSLDEMSELERLRAENKLLKAEKERAEMEISFLKKLEEIERRWD